MVQVNQQAPKYANIGAFFINTGYDLSELKDIDIGSAGTLNPDANGTRLIGRMVFIYGNQALANAGTEWATGKFYAPTGVIMRPLYYDPCFKGTPQDYVPSMHKVDSNYFIPSWPIAVRGVIAVRVKNARQYKAGDLVCFKSNDLSQGGGEIKIIKLINGKIEESIPPGYLPTSWRVYDFKSVLTSDADQDVLFIHCVDNASHIFPKAT